MKTFLTGAMLLTLSHQPQNVICMAAAVYHESRGEPFVGQVAVANVIMNRVKSPKYPNKVCEVVYQPAQFTDIEKVKIKFQSSEWKEALRIATITVNGLDLDPTDGALYYYAHNKISAPYWAKKLNVKVRIHNHTFLGE